MTEVTEEQPTAPLIVNGFYNRHGRVMIAVNATSLVAVVGDDTIEHTATPDDALMGMPGSPEWVNHMIRIRRELNQDLTNERRELKELKSWAEGLGIAIRDKAIEHGLDCSEYDEFAEQWGLPVMQSEHEVTMSIRVVARDSEDAKHFVREHFGLDHNDDRVVSDPEFNAEWAL